METYNNPCFFIVRFMLNSNMGCMETMVFALYSVQAISLNSNMGCMETLILTLQSLCILSWTVTWDVWKQKLTSICSEGLPSWTVTWDVWKHAKHWTIVFFWLLLNSNMGCMETWYISLSQALTLKLNSNTECMETHIPSSSLICHKVRHFKNHKTRNKS